MKIGDKVITKAIEKEYTIVGGLKGEVIELSRDGRDVRVRFEIGETIWILTKYLRKHPVLIRVSRM